MCAQSPYNMRGLLVSLFVIFVFLSATVDAKFHFTPNNHTTGTKASPSLIIFSVETVVCLIGFLLLCVVARWYKKRVRDEDRVVEEVYDRYLTAAAAQTSRG